MSRPRRPSRRRSWIPLAPVAHAVDANVILRHLLSDDDELSSKAHAIFAAPEAGQVVLNCDPVSLAKVVWVLSSYYKVPHARIAESPCPLLQFSGFPGPDRERYLRALELYGQGVARFGDACACAQALLTCEGRLVSFDRKLSRVEDVKRAGDARGR